jgi:chromosome partitioning protein
MILAVGNTKGGVGKTTLAVNLAVALALAGRDLLLVDGDEQGTALTFTQLAPSAWRGGLYRRRPYRRGASQPGPPARGKYDDIIIDVGGRDTGSLRAALTVADTLLVPVQPRSFDVWALDQVAALVAEAREINEGLRAVAVLNGADAQGPTMRPPWK